MEDEWFLKMLEAVHCAGIEATRSTGNESAFDTEAFMDAITAAGYVILSDDRARAERAGG